MKHLRKDFAGVAMRPNKELDGGPEQCSQY